MNEDVVTFEKFAKKDSYNRKKEQSRVKRENKKHKNFRKNRDHWNKV